MSTPSYREELISQIPALQLLMAMGWQYLTPVEALALRGGKKSAVVLTGVLEPWVAEHNGGFQGGAPGAGHLPAGHA